MHNVNLTFTQPAWQSILKAADAAFRQSGGAILTFSNKGITRTE